MHACTCKEKFRSILVTFARDQNAAKLPALLPKDKNNLYLVNYIDQVFCESLVLLIMFRSIVLSTLRSKCQQSFA